MSQSSPETRLADICADLFLFLTTFRRTVGQVETDPEWTRKRLMELFDAQAMVASADLDMQRLYDKARYPLVALADEIALNTDWPGRDDWEEDLLEHQYFGTSVAGEEFYKKLKEVGPDEDQLAEIYFLCLSLGFKGRFRNRPEERREIQQQLYARLPHRIAKKSETLCPSAYEYSVERDMTRLPALTAARVAIVLAGAIVLAYLASDIVTRSIVSDTRALAKDIYEPEKR